MLLVHKQWIACNYYGPAWPVSLQENAQYEKYLNEIILGRIIHGFGDM